MPDHDFMKVEFEAPTFPQKKFREAVQEALIRTAEFTKEEWLKNLESYDLILTGEGARSIEIEIVNDTTVLLKSDENKAPYMIYHEFGAGPSHEPDPHSPYWPSRAALLDWVKKRHLRWRDKKGRFMSHQQIVDVLVFLQYKRGLLPKPCARPAFEKGRAEMKHITNDVFFRRFTKGDETRKPFGSSSQEGSVHGP